jgi:F-type H+-transporting ATPase subunit epsilon
MLLEILTPDKRVFEGQVDSATFPGSKGSFQVLNNHAPLISTLEKGKVVYVSKNIEDELFISGGVVEVLNNKVVLLAESILEEEDL